MVRPGEVQHWEKITPYYVTEESDDATDPMTIVEHKLVWRSQRKCIAIGIGKGKVPGAEPSPF